MKLKDNFVRGKLWNVNQIWKLLRGELDRANHQDSRQQTSGRSSSVGSSTGWWLLDYFSPPHNLRTAAPVGPARWRTLYNQSCSIACCKGCFNWFFFCSFWIKIKDKETHTSNAQDCDCLQLSGSGSRSSLRGVEDFLRKTSRQVRHWPLSATDLAAGARH